MRIESYFDDRSSLDPTLIIMEPLNAHFSLQIRQNLIEVFFSYSICLPSHFKGM